MPYCGHGTCLICWGTMDSIKQCDYLYHDVEYAIVISIVEYDQPFWLYTLVFNSVGFIFAKLEKVQERERVHIEGQ